MPRFKDQAVCIRHIDWSETSQVVTLLTETRGKMRGLAKGSKRTSPGATARYSGGIELLTCGEIVGMTRPTSDLANLTEWDLQNPLFHLRRDLAAQRIALYAADLCNALLADDDPHPVIYRALLTMLENVREPAGRGEALLRFQWTTLVDGGYRPQLDRDVRTGEPLDDRATYLFDPQAGGFTAELAAAHVDGPRGPWRVRGETLRLLQRLDAHVADSTNGSEPHGDSEAERANVPETLGASPQHVGRANRLLCVYFRTILDRELPTMGFILGSTF